MLGGLCYDLVGLCAITGRRYDLREGLQMTKAEEFANLLNEHIVRVAYTPNDPPSLNV